MSIKKIVGLDLSTHGVCAVELDNLNKTPVLKRKYKISLPAGIVGDGEVIDPDLLLKNLKTIWDKGKFSTKDVVIGIGNQRVLVRNKTVENVSLKNAKEALPFLVEKELPVPSDEAVVDFYTIFNNSEKKEVNGLIVAGIKTIILNNINALEKANLQIARVDLIPFALTRAFCDESWNSNTVIIMNIGYQNTSITIVDNGKPVFIRFIAAGADTITGEIQKLTGFDYDRSVEIQNQLGVGAKSEDDRTRMLATTINNGVNSIYKSIRNTLAYYQKNNPDKRYRSILMSGPGSLIPGLGDSLSKALGVPTSDANPLSNIKVAKNIDLSNEEAKEYSVAIGLGIGANKK